MSSPLPRLVSFAMAATVGLSGCGGGADTLQRSAPADSATSPAAQAMAATGTTPTLVVYARADVVNGFGAAMTVRVDNQTVGSTEVKNTTGWAEYRFTVPTLRAGSRVDVAFTNDIAVSGTDRNLHIAYLRSDNTVVLPTIAGAVIDRGSGSAAFDGLDLLPASPSLYSNGALRLKWPENSPLAAASMTRRYGSVRFLTQASFGPTRELLDELDTKTYAAWITEQLALPVSDDYVAAVQARYNLGPAYRPHGGSYDPYEVTRTFWRQVQNSPDQLRKRVAFALHQTLMASLTDSNLWGHSRAYAAYLDLLNRHALGNFRTLLEEIALSPTMGIYLSHMRNRKEDPTTGRVPDENFAREIMQLFTIGLHELNNDGTPKRDAAGRLIQTYSNDDVMALAKVFTGYSWSFADNQLTEDDFRFRSPDYSATADLRVDLKRMRAYPGQHSTAEKTLFSGKPWVLRLPAGNSADADVRAALDTLFNHPNVGPFISRQLIQRLVTSQPSAAYVARVASVFNNNGKGVRGDLGAVARAILLDAEARTLPAADSPTGKLREPVLAVAHWMRAFNAKSPVGLYSFNPLIADVGQSMHRSPSVFGHFRPGYVPPGTAFSTRAATAPEFQVVNENAVASWIVLAELMSGHGIGWVNGRAEISANYDSLITQAGTGNLGPVIDEIDLMLFGGRMSSTLRQTLVDALVSVANDGPTLTPRNRARLAVFLALASPEYLVQR